MASKILVLNSGSSSLKYKLYEHASQTLSAVASGVVERIGDLANSQLKVPKSHPIKAEVKDHKSALQLVLSHIRDSVSQHIENEVQACGHRVVHGKEISRALVVTAEVERQIEDAASLAPLHNPPNLQGIRAAAHIFQGKPQVAVFDTAFHQTMEPRAYLYALPWELYKDKGIRRYGAHGTSYRYLVGEAARMLGRPADSLNLIIAHVGAGASMAAIRGGKTVDTTMGLTPLEGLMMGTRCGDIDPAAVIHMGQGLGMSLPDIDNLMNKNSGFLGLAGVADLRQVLEGRAKGEERASAAYEVFIHRLRKYVGAYLLQLGHVDAFVWSAGIGENSAAVRGDTLAGLQAFGFDMDQDLNTACVGSAGTISSQSSDIKVLVIPTDEELSIAQQTIEALKQSG